jgi:hypothetical protein
MTGKTSSPRAARPAPCSYGKKMMTLSMSYWNLKQACIIVWWSNVQHWSLARNWADPASSHKMIPHWVLDTWSRVTKMKIWVRVVKRGALTPVVVFIGGGAHQWWRPESRQSWNSASGLPFPTMLRIRETCSIMHPISGISDQARWRSYQATWNHGVLDIPIRSSGDTVRLSCHMT